MSLTRDMMFPLIVRSAPCSHHRSIACAMQSQWWRYAHWTSFSKQQTVVLRGWARASLLECPAVAHWAHSAPTSVMALQFVIPVLVLSGGKVGFCQQCVLLCKQSLVSEILCIFVLKGDLGLRYRQYRGVWGRLVRPTVLSFLLAWHK